MHMPFSRECSNPYYNIISRAVASIPTTQSNSYVRLLKSLKISDETTYHYKQQWPQFDGASAMYSTHVPDPLTNTVTIPVLPLGPFNTVMMSL